VTIVVVFMVGLAAIAGWWLSHQRLGAKPWLEEGVIGDFPGSDRLGPPTAKIGLGVFLAVAGSLFALVLSAYSMRMALLDWRAIPIPPLLWFNTAVLVVSSLALQWAVVAARRGDRDSLFTGLLAAGVSAVIFLVGQLLAWQQLVSAGFVLQANPSNAFFYMITAIHGLHLLGGLVALGRTIAKAWRDAAAASLRLSVELCAMYWHFLLLIWLILLAVLTGWPIAFFNICRQLLS
jgi:cytochrome c oxidase subunit 3